MKSVLLLFIVIMGFVGGLFAQAPIPIRDTTKITWNSWITHDSVMKAHATIDSMVYYQCQVYTINCCGSYVVRHPVGNWADQRVWRITELNFASPKLKVISKRDVEFNTNRPPLKLGLMFISGAADGMTQVIAFHPDRFFAQHPNANRQFWDNSISWRNKYRNGDPQQGRAFVGSTTWLAWTTDAYHLFRTTSRLTAVAGLTIPIYKGSGKKLRHYAAEIGLSGLAWSAGFHTTYSLLYK